MHVLVEDLAVHFGRVVALAGVSLNLSPGEVAVLAGPNGAGKSTLMSVLLGLLKPDAGRVLVNGVDLASGRRVQHRVREQLGYLPESVAFADNLTGRQVLRFFARARGISRARMEAVLERVGLAKAAGRPVRGYSRGMRQRLGLGVAIIAEPELLILDEPTGGLDQQGLSLLWELLAEWRAAGRSALVSTHDLALIESRADRVYVLSEGRVVAEGSPDMLRKQTDLPVRVRVELSSAVHAESVAGLISGQLGAPVDLGERGFDVRVPQAALLSVLQTISERSALVTHLRVEEAGLDAVYERLLEVP